MKRDQVRLIDQTAIEAYGMPGVILMENAGRGAAEAILHQAPSKASICILCGPGNNGGDGYVIARHLQLAGRQVTLISLVELETLSGDAAINANIAVAADLPLQTVSNEQTLQDALPQDAVIVDCLLGTGARGAPRGLYASAIKLANQRAVYRVAIDLPSGMDCDTGQIHEPTFQADLTLTFVCRKEGMQADSAATYLGAVQVISIGVPLKLLQDFDVPAS
ncbi:Bifunctional NAD(P)H-hydrate repair enzyme Nnr [Stieleria bergensis]|uniref:NAD(P)H-hydrate epimerase n=2 Tax=Stieleria bergensis TaxID=2528025 RepID=A0A517SX88_9BACT|nr:Bifunctional NAD(P)H-hydrate repair enzyme Nnr [Planctomycetes bacterium SV_7m_r]